MIQDSATKIFGSRPSASLFNNYDLGGFFDEKFEGACPRPHYRRLHDTLGKLTAAEFRARCELADLTLVNQGISFTVYGDAQGLENRFRLT